MTSVSSFHADFQVEQYSFCFLFVHLVDDRLRQLTQRCTGDGVINAHRNPSTAIFWLVGPDESAGDAALVFIYNALVLY